MGPCDFGKPRTLGTGMLQNSEILLIMIKIIENLGFNNANSFFFKDGCPSLFCLWSAIRPNF